MKNSVFTNVAETSDGNVWWEGIGHEPTGDVTSWLNEPWSKDSGKPAAHPNSRFCAPAAQVCLNYLRGREFFGEKLPEFSFFATKNSLQRDTN